MSVLPQLGFLLLTLVWFEMGVSVGPAQAAYPAQDGRAVVGLVTDGPAGGFETIFEDIKFYLKELSGETYEFEFIEDYVGDFTPRGILRELERALADPRIDVVYAGGPIATELAGALPSAVRTKPVFGGFPEFSQRHHLALTPDGASAIENFTYASTSNRVVADVTALARLSHQSEIHVVLDTGIYDLFRDDTTQVSEIEARMGVKVHFYPATSFADEALSMMPTEAAAVYVAFLPRFSEHELRKLFAKLTDRKSFTMSMFGPSGLVVGATASLAPDLRDPIARRSALNLHLLFLGRGTDELAVHLPNEDRLVINMPIANAIGWAPDYETHLTAEFIGESLSSVKAPTLTLDDAMNRAATSNSNALASRHAAGVARADERITASAARPALDLITGHSVLRRTDPIDPFAPSHQDSGSYGVRLRQVLFDDNLWSAIQAQRHSSEAAEFDARSAELDARAAGGTGFLQWVLAEMLYRIEQENLDLTESNLRLAKLRVTIGTAERTEVYRWESEVAGDRANLFQRESARHNAMVTLNRTMASPRAMRWRPTEIRLGKSEIFFMNETLSPLIQNGAWLESLASFFEHIATELSPELQSFDKTLRAQGILLKQKKRAYYVPSVTFEAGYDRVAAGSEGLETDAENQWTAGIGLELPLFEGGRRRADIDRQRSLIAQIAAQRLSAVEAIEEQARTTFNTMAADHANIRLSTLAYEGAEKNYKAVSNKYSQGVATILDLLDAQSRLLLQRQQIAAATYGYLIDVVSLQRAIGWFEKASSEEEKASIAERLQEYVKTWPKSRTGGRGKQSAGVQ